MSPGRQRPTPNDPAFRNTQHPATHLPRWRSLGTRGKGTYRWPHRVCGLCSHVEYRTQQGAWVQERGRCWHE
jgi:hypothetical protein